MLHACCHSMPGTQQVQHSSICEHVHSSSHMLVLCLSSQLYLLQCYAVIVVIMVPSGHLAQRMSSVLAQKLSCLTTPNIVITRLSHVHGAACAALTLARHTSAGPAQTVTLTTRCYTCIKQDCSMCMVQHSPWHVILQQVQHRVAILCLFSSATVDLASVTAQ
jgi:hypothetical protein